MNIKVKKNEKKTLIESRLNNDWKIKTLINVRLNLMRHVLFEKIELKTLIEFELNNDWKNKTLIKNRTSLMQHVIFKKIKLNIDKKAKKEKTLIEFELNNDWKIKTLIITRLRLMWSRDSKKSWERKKKEKNKTKKMTRLNFMKTVDFEEKKKKFENLIKIFKSTMNAKKEERFRFSRKNDFITLIKAQKKLSIVKIKVFYKRKDQKIRFVNLSKFDESKFENEFDWKKVVLKNEISKRTYDFIDRFVEYLILKFSDLTKNVKLIFERLKRLRIEEFLWDKKKTLLTKMMYNRERVLTWNFTHKEQIKFEIWSSIKIKTISHETWQTSTFQISRALQKTMTKMIKKRLESEMIEFYYNLYRNSWFLMKKKKSRKYRLINAIIMFNKMTIKNVNLLSMIDEFVKIFAKCEWIFLINLFFDYNQFSLNEASRDMIAYMTSLRLIQKTTFFIKAINSMTQFMRDIRTILKNHISKVTNSFINDIEMKERKKRKKFKEELSFILKYDN